MLWAQLLDDDEFTRRRQHLIARPEAENVIPGSDGCRQLRWALTARAGTGLSQAQFAKLIGVSLRTLQEWEQGRKRPSGPAAALLRIVARDPDVVGALNR